MKQPETLTPDPEFVSIIDQASQKEPNRYLLPRPRTGVDSLTGSVLYGEKIWHYEVNDDSKARSMVHWQAK